MLNKLQLVLLPDPFFYQGYQSSFICHPSPKNNYMKINMIHNMVVFFHINSVVTLQIQPKGSSNDSDIKNHASLHLNIYQFRRLKESIHFLGALG